MQITFFGSDEYSQIVLSHLLASPASHQITLITTSSDSSPAKLAAQNDLSTILYPQTQPLIKDLHPKLGVLASFGAILPPEVINLFPAGILCLHPSLLPQYRGATPVPHAIALGEKTTGITLFKLTSRVDEGEVLARQELEIAPGDTTPSLLSKLFSLGSTILLQHLQPTSDYKVPNLVNLSPPKKVIFTRRFTRDTGYLTWETFRTIVSGSFPNLENIANPLLKLRLSDNPPNKPIEALHDLTRALTPWPGVWTTAPGKKGDLRLVITSALPTIKVKLPGKPQPISYQNFCQYYL